VSRQVQILVSNYRDFGGSFWKILSHASRRAEKDKETIYKLLGRLEKALCFPNKLGFSMFFIINFKNDSKSCKPEDILDIIKIEEKILLFVKFEKFINLLNLKFLWLIFYLQVGSSLYSLSCSLVFVVLFSLILSNKQWATIIFVKMKLCD